MSYSIKRHSISTTIVYFIVIIRFDIPKRLLVFISFAMAIDFHPSWKQVEVPFSSLNLGEHRARGNRFANGSIESEVEFSASSRGFARAQVRKVGVGERSDDRSEPNVEAIRRRKIGKLERVFSHWSRADARVRFISLIWPVCSFSRASGGNSTGIQQIH